MSGKHEDTTAAGRELEARFVRHPGDSGTTIAVPRSAGEEDAPERLHDPAPDFEGTWERQTGEDERPAVYWKAD